MIVDEMELMNRLKDVEPLPSEVAERAKMVLRAAMAVDGGPEVVPVRARRHRQRRTMVLRGTAGVAAAAAVAALALVATSPGHPAEAPTASDHEASSHAASPLVRLADDVSRSSTPAGNATLVARTTALGGGQSVTVYDLYADDGQCFFSQTESGLPAQVSADDNLAGGLFAREIAAAKLAATGNVTLGGEDMAAAPDPGKYVPQTTQTTRLSGPDATKPGAYPGEVVGSQYDNYVWENSQDALVAGSGDPQVRAGVLQILATLPDVTVTHGTSAGQSTLVLTAGAAEVGAGSIEQLTINATTGVPVSFASGATVQALTTAVTYQVSRVTTSDIAAGKF